MYIIGKFEKMLLELKKVPSDDKEALELFESDINNFMKNSGYLDKETMKIPYIDGRKIGIDIYKI